MYYYLKTNKYESSNLEITEQEITNKYQGKNFPFDYPRHISSNGFQSYRNNRLITHKNRCLPKTCQLPQSQSEVNSNTHIALDILKYQLNDQKAKKTHLDNVRRSLEKRLQAAKVSGNYHLVALLEKEFQQLEMNV